MRPKANWLGVGIVVVMMAAMTAFVVAVFKYTNSQFILGILGVAVAIITASFQYRAAKDKETESRLFSQKQAVYSELVGMTMNLFHEKKVDSNKDDQAEMVKNLQKIRTQLLIWGSAATLQALDALSGFKADSVAPTTPIIWLSGLFGAIRKDLGHKDPAGAALEMALGVLNEPDRSQVRAAISKA
jgi:predicted tellurium resistance membrane protein TerC